MAGRARWFVADSEHVHRPLGGVLHPHLAAEVNELAYRGREATEIVAELTHRLRPEAAARARAFAARS